MRRDCAQLPVDFLAGFTIFILSLIMVSNYVPSLLVGLQRTSGIDYDAVAYRTGVVLVEDPGDPAGYPILGVVEAGKPRPWEQQTAPVYIDRLGLAIMRDTPNILSINKIERFFCTTFFSDTDYRNKILFTSYQYGYNITLQNLSPMKPGDPPFKKMVGDPYPVGYGYIRRYVVIKQNSNATINLQTYWIANAFNAQREEQVRQEYRILLDGRLLYNKSIDNHLKIDLQREPVLIRIENLSSVLNNSHINSWSPIANSSVQWVTNLPPDNVAPKNATLTAVRFYKAGTNNDISGYAEIALKVDSEAWEVVPPLGDVNKKVWDVIDLRIQPLLPDGPSQFDSEQAIEIGLTFQDPIPHTLITGTFMYDYNNRNVTQPVYSTGMLEVGIW